MSNNRVVARNSVWLIAQPFALNIASMVVVAVIARHLGPAGYGGLVLFLAIVALLAPFINLGLRPYMVREVAGNPERVGEIAGELIPVRLILTTVTLSIAAAIYPLLPSGMTLSWVALSCVAAQVVLNSLNTSLIDALYGLERMRASATAMLVSGVFMQSALAAAALMKLDLDYLLIIYVLGNLILGWRLRAALGDKTIGLRWLQAIANVGRYLGASWKFAVPGILGTIRAQLVPLFTVGALGTAPLGQFGAAATLLEKLDVVPDGVGTALYPRVVSLSGRDPKAASRLVRTLSRLMLMVASAICVGLLFLSDAIVQLIFGPAFHETGTLLLIMGTALPFTFLTVVMFNVLNATGNQHSVAILSAIVTVVGLVLLAVFVSIWGVLGVAVAYAVGSVINWTLYRWVFVRKFGALLDFVDLGKILLANAAMALGLWACPEINVLFKIVLGAVIFGVFSMVLKLVSIKGLVALLRSEPTV